MNTPLSPIYRNCRRLLVLTEDMARRFGRYHKYTVGTDLRQAAIALMRTMHQAEYDKPHQAQHVQALVARLDDYKLTLKLAKLGRRAPALWHAPPRDHPQPIQQGVRMNKRLWLLAVLASPVLMARAVCPTWPTAERFTLNGAEVTDRRTGLVWARCSVGQSWNGSTCTGNHTGLTHEAAMQHAASQSGWRLPNVKEMSSLVDMGCNGPAIDGAAFPGVASVTSYWTSTPKMDGSDGAWGVYLSNGSVATYFRNVTNAVRLVRASQ